MMIVSISYRRGFEKVVGVKPPSDPHRENGLSPRFQNKDVRGFTRIDAIAVAAGLALLLCVVLPALGGTRPRAQQLMCMDNLRQVGQAIHVWMGDHGDKVPWIAEYADGGNRNAAPASPAARFGNNLWFQFSSISNELVSPKFLACPSDLDTVAATRWDDKPGGFLNSQRQNIAISYSIDCHATLERPNGILSADRSIKVDSGLAACSVGFFIVNVIGRPALTTGWGPVNFMHGNRGNGLSMDGRVVEYSDESLRAVFNAGANDQASAEHLLLKTP